MRVVFISPEFDKSLAFVFEEGLVEGIVSKKDFVKIYGDWQVYSEQNDPFTYKLIGRGLVKQFY